MVHDNNKSRQNWKVPTPSSNAFNNKPRPLQEGPSLSVYIVQGALYRITGGDVRELILVGNTYKCSINGVTQQTWQVQVIIVSWFNHLQKLNPKKSWL